MKIVFIVLSVLSFSLAYNDCSIVAPRKVICHGDSGEISLFRMRSDETFVGKTYIPQKKYNLEIVVAADYGIIDLKPICVSSMIYLLKDSASTPKNVFDDIDSLCAVIEKGDFENLKNGVVGKIPGFKSSIGKPKMLSRMDCTSSSYYDFVKTVKFNEITGLRTDLREYDKLKRGTYCKDFLATDELFWSPSK